MQNASYRQQYYTTQVKGYHEATEELPFPSWKRGESRRERIVEVLNSDPTATIEEIGIAVNLSKWQVKRHLKILKNNFFGTP